MNKNGDFLSFFEIEIIFQMFCSQTLTFHEKSSYWVELYGKEIVTAQIFILGAEIWVLLG